MDSTGFYILDIYKGKALFKFGLQGNLFYKINSIGEGPGQFYLPFDFDLNPGGRNLLILGTNQRNF
jgi:hypothetical protein